MKEAQARADKAKPHVEPAAVKRKAEANAIIEATAKKMKEAAEKAEKQKAQRRQQMLIDAAAQYIKPEYGKLSKKGKDAIKPSPKICRCHLSASGAGAHKDTCSFHPHRLASAIRMNHAMRESLEAQLLKTSMTKAQREFALKSFFGPEVPGIAKVLAKPSTSSAAAAASSSSSSSAPPATSSSKAAAH